MSKKKQTNFLIGSIVLLILVLGVFFTSSSNSELVLVDKVPSITPAITSTDEAHDIDEEEIVDLMPSISIAPTLTSVEIPVSVISQATYRVVKVVDGDTLDVNIDGKIERLRLIGIDTPETFDPRKSVQCFGKEASNKAKELLMNQFVTLEADESQGERDKYKRLLRYVFLPDGTNFNFYMISEGFANEYTYNDPYKYQAEFKQAQMDARSANKGLWDPLTCNGSK